MNKFTDSKYDPKVINQKIIKSSRLRLVVSADNVELYQYSQPYHYNFPPLPRSFRGVSHGMVQFESKEKVRRLTNIQNCRQRIRRLIDSNVGQYGQLTKFITLTFKENETNLSTANKEYGYFIKRLNYQLGFKAKYLTVVEFQKRGAIHYHSLFFNLPYIDNVAPFVEKIWTHGNVDVKALKNVKSVGAYVTKYIQKETLDGRLAREKAFFCSKGLYQPLELKNERKIAEFLKSCIIETIARKEYRSGYHGDITYTKGYLANK